MEVPEAKRLETLEDENTRLKRLLADAMVWTKGMVHPVHAWCRDVVGDDFSCMNVSGLSRVDCCCRDPSTRLMRPTPIRDGSVHELSLSNVNGIVQFPSFHTTLAIMFVYSSRNVRILFPIMVCACVAMIAATPVFGGHYLADALGGAAITVAAIAAVRIYQTCTQSALRSTTAPTI